LTPEEDKILDLQILQRDRHQTSKGLPFKLLEEIATTPVAKRWIIKGIFARGETSAWIGPPGSLKSALFASAAVSIASGTDWFGRRSKEACGVLYFALERADLVERRLIATAEGLGLRSKLPIAVVPVTIDLVRPQSVQAVINTIKAAEDAAGRAFGLCAFDTWPKLLAAGGGDENQAKDQGVVFANIQRVKGATDVHVALIGHTGKNEERGARGSNALDGHVDLMVALVGDSGIKTATITKANDAPEGPLFSFKSEVFDFGEDEDGDPITVNVVSQVEARTAPSPSKPNLKPNQKTAFAILHDAGSVGLLTEEWNAKAREAGIGVHRRADLVDIRNALKSKGLVREMGGRWVVNHSS
jgi:AAA domain